MKQLSHSPLRLLQPKKRKTKPDAWRAFGKHPENNRGKQGRRGQAHPNQSTVSC